MKLSKISMLLIGAAFGVSAAAQDVNIAVVLALTGAYAAPGVAEKEGVQVAIEEMEKTKPLGNRRVVAMIEDNASDKAQVINLFTRYGKRSDVAMIVGPTSSFEGVVAAPIANDLKVPMLGVSSASAAITAAGPWSFKTYAEGNDSIPAIANYGADKLGIKSVVTIHARNNDGQVGQLGAAVTAFAAKNVKVLGQESVLGTDTDFQSVVTKVVALAPDAIFLTLSSSQAANFVIQARQAGLPVKVKILGTGTLATDDFIKLGGAAVNGSYFLIDYFVGLKTPQNQRFVAAYTAKYNRPPDNWAALGYASMMIAVDAIRRAGPNPTRDAIRVALTNTKNISVPLGRVGSFSFDAQRKAAYEPMIGIIDAGKIVEAP